MDKDDIKKLYNDLLNLTKRLGDLLGEDTYKNLDNIEEKEDVSNIFICLYNQDCVGLFHKYNLVPNSEENRSYTSGDIYQGINSSYVAIKFTHKGIRNVNYWAKQGTSIKTKTEDFTVNCDMTDSISFDDLRFIMYKDYKSKPYEIGSATHQEILDVLDYSINYFQNKKEEKDKPKQLMKKAQD